jgi:hypothetical protein
MANILIDENIYKDLSNKDLIKKQEDIEIKLSKARVMSSLPADIVEDLTKLAMIIDREIDRRLDNGTMDEDELEEDF